MMLETLSPPIRRVVALGMLVFIPLLFLTMVVTPLVSMAIEAVERLERVRIEHGRLIAILARPPSRAGPPVPNGLTLEGQRSDLALSAINARAGSIAASRAIKIQGLTEQGGDRPDEVRARLVATGPGTALAEMINQLEREAPLVRLATWSLATQGASDRSMRLDAIVVAPMTGPAP